MTTADLWQGKSAMSLRRVLTQLAQRRTWSELLYALIGLPIGIAGFVFTAVTFTLSTGLLITFIGLPLMAVTGLASRGIGGGLRRLSNRLDETKVPRPQAFRRNPGVLGWLGSCLSDGTAWRARLYLLLRLPVGILGCATAIVFYAYGLFGVSYWTWRPFLNCNYGPDGVCHGGPDFGQHRYLDTPGLIALTFLIGVVLLLAAPWAVRGVLSIDRLLVRGLLGPTAGAERVEQLERTRAVAVDDSAATLRRIERDLHDGAQARLVALAMNVGLAREKLAEGGDPAGASALLDTAHRTAKEAIVELRDLARGIHPPALDAGLDAALATLAAHSPVPVELRVAVTERPDPAIETMAYFCAAELLTNVAKHAGAGQVAVDVTAIDGRLWLRVWDDGSGAAALGAGSGLAGLAERVATVDGTLTVDSPAGGPTSVVVDVPLRAGSTT